MYSYLSKSQRAAVDSIESGDNVFITGAAGTGKSYLLHYLCKTLKKNLQITATTGIAAVNIGGVTLHSWANLGLEEIPIEKIAQKIMSPAGTHTRRKIIDTELLAIDEISMLSRKTFESLDELLRIVRGKDKPFGGIQLLLFGDFFQLPPVKSEYFCFESLIWEEAGIKTFILREIFRQQNQRFIELLDNIRHGIIHADDVELLKSRFLVKCEKTAIKPTILSTHNILVERINHDKLNSLVSKEVTYEAKFSGASDKIELLRRNCLARELLTLKIGSQVMMLKNTHHRDGIINGSTGIVVGFSTKKCYPLVEFENGHQLIVTPESWEISSFNQSSGELEVQAMMIQIPLALAWAITVHKSQGMTLDRAECDLKNSFSYGQVYVALSRIRDLEGIFIRSFDVNAIKVDPRILEFYEKLENNQE